MKSSLTVAIAFLLLCIATSCRKELDGSGNQIREKRNPQIFSGIQNDGPFRIVVQKGAAYEIIVEGEDNIVDQIETVSLNGILKVSYKDPSRRLNHKLVTVTLTTPVLNHVILKGTGEVLSNDRWPSALNIITVTGAGSVHLNLETEKVKTLISGSGMISLSGSALLGEHVLSGSGALHAYDLVNTNSITSLSGSGRCELNVVNKLEASITGSGTIFYSGNPARLDVSVSGSGKIVKQ